MDWICLESMTEHKAGAIASVLAKCLQMSESSTWPMPSSFRWELRGSTRKCIFLFIEGEMRDVMGMKWDILGCGRCLTEAAGFILQLEFPFPFPDSSAQLCLHLPLWTHSSPLPFCCYLHLPWLKGFSPSQVPTIISQLHFAKFNFLSSISFKKKIIHLLPSDINVTADTCSPGSQAICWVEQFIN